MHHTRWRRHQRGESGLPLLLAAGQRGEGGVVHRARGGGQPPPVGDVVQRPEHLRQSGEGYRRLPNAMTLHDAERTGFSGKFDKDVVPVYSLVTHQGGGGGGGAAVTDGEDGDRGPSKSILDPDCNGNDDGTSYGDNNEGEVGNGA